MKIWARTAAVLSFFLVVSVQGAQPDYPALFEPVHDFAGILSPETVSRLTAYSKEIEKKTSAALAVVTVETTAPATIEEYAVKLFRNVGRDPDGEFGLGDKDKNNGVLLLVAVKDRQTRIEVGYGLEGAIPDAKAYAVYKKILVPNFRSGDYNRGISRGAEALAGMIAGEYGVEISGLPEVNLSEATETGNASIPGILGGIFFVALFLLILGLRTGLFGAVRVGGRRRGRYWYGGGGSSGGGFSGGFGGFGGGMSGGGGAGGGW